MRCGCDDPLVLTFDHIVPLRRGRNGIKRNRQNSSDVWKQLLRGDIVNVQLLSANCHMRKTKLEDDRDGQMHLNLKHLEPKELAVLPLFEGLTS